MLADVLQQQDLARSDSFVAVEIDADAQLGKRFGASAPYDGLSGSLRRRLPVLPVTDKANVVIIARSASPGIPSHR